MESNRVCFIAYKQECKGLICTYCHPQLYGGFQLPTLLVELKPLVTNSTTQQLNNAICESFLKVSHSPLNDRAQTHLIKKPRWRTRIILAPFREST